MHDGNVVTLEVVVNVNLPVAVDDVIPALGKRQLREGKFPSQLRNVANKFGEGRSIRSKIDKNKLLPGFASQRHHTLGGAIKKFYAVNFGGPDEPAIERVRPAVIRAIQNIPRSGTLRDGPRAVPANVAEGAKGACFVAHDNHRLPRHFNGEIRFGINDGALDAVDFAAGLAQRPHQLPRTPENALLLNREDRRVGVEARGQRFCAFKLRMDVERLGFGHHGKVGACRFSERPTTSTRLK